jgi:hypothetical protein
VKIDLAVEIFDQILQLTNSVLTVVAHWNEPSHSQSR